MPNVNIDPHLFVIMGTTGDLTRRKLLPALYHLARMLEDRCLILGVAREADLDDRGFRTWARKALEKAGFSAEELDRWCDRCLYYQPVGQGSSEDYHALGGRIKSLEGEHGLPGNRAFYMALPPVAFPGAITGIGEAGLGKSPGWTRLVIEKPFGRDLASARELNALVHRYFDESQVYRIDHYLGKETVQNLLVFRFSNPIFESLWNRDRVASVQITVAEELGVEGRAGYYERAGALRDMVQNHMTQLLTLIAMEVPVSFEADAIRHEKVKVLRSLAPLRPEQAVLGQYARGKVDGREVPGYREEPGIAPDSQTETFVALRVEVNSWRWQGVPFYLRTGKRLPRKLTRIDIVFHDPPVCLFHGSMECKHRPNILRITLQPDEGFDLYFGVKATGESSELKSQTLHFGYQDVFGPLPDAYQTLIIDVMKGDQTLFVHADEVETSWRYYAPLLERENAMMPYAAGAWGPPESDLLLDERGHHWQPEYSKL